MNYYENLRCWLVCGTVLSVAAGCAADAPFNLHQDGAPIDAIPVPDSPAGCDPARRLPPPVVAAFPNPASNALQAFRGTAPGASLLRATGSRGNAVPQSVGSDGKFCIEVPLLPDADNRITFTANSAAGCPGIPRTVTVRHRTKAGVDAGVNPPSNVAKLATVTSKDAPLSNPLSFVTDGKSTTWSRFSFTDWEISSGDCTNNFTWIQLALGKTYTVDKFKVKWAAATQSDNEFGKCFTVLWSASANPGDPKPAGGGLWKTARVVTTGTSATQTISVSPAATKSVAFLLYENDSRDLLPPPTEEFKLAEVEVWGTDPTSTTPPAPDRCQ